MREHGTLEGSRSRGRQHSCDLGFRFCRSDAPDKPPEFRDERGRFWFDGAHDGSDVTLRASAVKRGETIEQARRHWQRCHDDGDILLEHPPRPETDIHMWMRAFDERWMPLHL